MNNKIGTITPKYNALAPSAVEPKKANLNL